MTSTFDDRIVCTDKVLHTHEDPASRTATKYVYCWENLRNGKRGRSPVWIFADAPGDIDTLIRSWNRRKPREWRFELVGVSRNPRRRRNPTWDNLHGVDHESFLQHLNRSAAQRLIREAILPPRRRIRKPKKRNPPKQTVDTPYKGSWAEREAARRAAYIHEDRKRDMRSVQEVLGAIPCGRKNPPRDPAYQGAFTLGHEPKRTGDFVDGDTVAVQSPHARHTHLERDYEVWVFGMIDASLGNTWNYVSGPMAKSDAIVAAKRLARL